jgi:hypothetical protein
MNTLVMWFVYFDESKQDNKVFVYSALIVDGEQWNSAFEGLKNLRRDLRSKHGVYMRQELHAWKFTAGKGQIADRPVLKPERAIPRWPSSPHWRGRGG